MAMNPVDAILNLNFEDAEAVAARRRDLFSCHPCVVIRACLVSERMKECVAQINCPMFLYVDASTGGVKLKGEVGDKTLFWDIRYGEEENENGGYHSVAFMVEYRTEMVARDKWITTVKTADTAYSQIVNFIASVYRVNMDLTLDISSRYYGCSARIVNGVRTSSLECSSSAAPPNPLRLQRLVQNLNSQSTLVLQSMPFERFRFRSTLRCEEFFLFDDALWFDFACLQTTRCQFYYLAQTALNSEDICSYIRMWISGELPQLCLLNLNHEGTLDHQKIVDALQPLPPQRENRQMPKLYREWLPTEWTRRSDFVKPEAEDIMSIVTSESELLIFVWNLEEEDSSTSTNSANDKAESGSSTYFADDEDEGSGSANQ